MITEQIAEIREWLKTWGGKLSVAAAGIGTTLAENALTALGIADYVPAGWPRGLVLVLIGIAIVVTPMKAAKKDAASAAIPDA